MRQKSKLIWMLTGVLAAFVVIGAVYIIHTISRQERKDEPITSEEFSVCLQEYGIDSETPYQDLVQLCGKGELAVIADREIEIAIGERLPDNTQLLELKRQEDGYRIDYVRSDGDDVYDCRVILLYQADGKTEITVCEGNEIITFSSDLVKRIQIVA